MPTKLQRVIFLGRKAGAKQALDVLIARKIRVTLVITPDPELAAHAQRLRIPVIREDAMLYTSLKKNSPPMRNIDLVISYLYPYKMRQPLIDLPARGCVNFHPAPLPDYKSRAGYNTAILERKKKFGVSAHFVDSEKFDAGPIIQVDRFPIDSNSETAWSLEKKAQQKLLDLFKTVITKFETGKHMRTIPNRGGLYWNLHQREALKKIDPKKESLEDINRKIRAFFFPPHSGATITIKGKDFTLIDQEILAAISKFLHET